MRVALAALVLVAVSACTTTPTTPTQTTPPAAPTRIISLTGNLSFGEVNIGTTAERVVRISNSGSDILIISGIFMPEGFSASPTSGLIQARGGQDVTFRFSPTERKDYAGDVSVEGNYTAGNSYIDINGAGR
jgi:hypothetical protein